MVATARRLVRARWFGPLVIVAAVLVGNGVYLLGLTNPNPLGSVAAVTVSRTAGYLPGNATIDPNAGFVNQAIGHAVARQLLGGHLPQWDPNQGAGMPLLASAQSAALFPPTLLARASKGLLYESILLELIAGLSTYALARRLRVGPLAATFAGVAFALDGTFAWLQNGAMLPVAFIPLVLLGVERAVAHGREGRRGGWILLAVAIGLLVQAGFVETAYIAGLLIAPWTIWRLVTSSRSRRAASIRKVAAGVGAGGLLSAPLLLSFVNYLGVADLLGHSGSLAESTYPLHALPTFVGLPYAYGPIFAFDDKAGHISAVWARVGGFVTPAVVVLALCGLVSPGRRVLRGLLAAWCAFCLLKSFGPHWLVVAVNHVPGMSSVAFYRYMTPSLELALILLAAFGLDALIRRDLGRALLGGVALVSAGLFVWAERVAAPVTASSPDAARALHLSFAWAAVVLVVIAAVSQVPDPRVRRGVITGLAVLDALLCFGVPTLSAPRSYRTDTASVTWLRDHLGNQRAYSFGPISANYGTYFDVPIAGMTNVPLPKVWSHYLGSNWGAGLDLANFTFRADAQAAVEAKPQPLRDLAVTYLLVGHGATLPDPIGSEVHLVHSDRLADVYRFDRSVPYFSAAGCAVESRSRTTATVRCPHPAALVRREMTFPGWSATVDGRAAPVTPRDGLFQSVQLPAGTSTVRFAYTTPYLGLGLGLSGAAVAWMVAAALDLPRWLHRTPARPATS